MGGYISTVKDTDCQDKELLNIIQEDIPKEFSLNNDISISGNVKIKNPNKEIDITGNVKIKNPNEIDVSGNINLKEDKGINVSGNVNLKEDKGINVSGNVKLKNPNKPDNFNSILYSLHE